MTKRSDPLHSGTGKPLPFQADVNLLLTTMQLLLMSTTTAFSRPENASVLNDLRFEKKMLQYLTVRHCRSFWRKAFPLVTLSYLLP